MDSKIEKDFDVIFLYAHFWNWRTDWIILKDIYTDFPDSFSVLLPFAYSYLEEMIRSLTSEYGIIALDKKGKEIEKRKIGLGLINIAIEENNDDEKLKNILENQQSLMKVITEIQFYTDICIQGFGKKKILKA